MSVRRGAHECTYKRQRAVVSGGFAVKPVGSCIFHGLSATRFARQLRVSGSAVAGARSPPRVWMEARLRPGALVPRSSLLGKSQPLPRASLSSCVFRILLRTWRSFPGQIWGAGDTGLLFTDVPKVCPEKAGKRTPPDARSLPVFPTPSPSLEREAPPSFPVAGAPSLAPLTPGEIGRGLSLRVSLRVLFPHPQRLSAYDSEIYT